MVIAGLSSAMGAAGCSLAKQDDTGSSPDEVVSGGNSSALLKSTLVLEGGCTAAKVGPKHLLISARCVTNNPAFAVGKVLKFASAANAAAIPAAPPADAPNNADPDNADPDNGDDGAGASDAGASDAASDAAPAASDAGGAIARDVTIADIQIHSSFASSCKAADVCGFGKIGASDAADIAVIILKDELTTVPSIPVDLDPVGQADPLLVVNAGCSTPDSRATVAPRLTKSIAVPAKSVNHQGSPYVTQPALVTRLAASYVVTPGSGWHTSDPRLCKTDMGSPIYRAGSSAVAGVTSNYTTYASSKLPVTTQHTRVDSMSRFKIGDWLGTLGVLTVHSCSEMAGGCAKHSYDGGVPTQSASGDGTTATPGDGGKTTPISPDAGDDDSDAGPDMPDNSDQPHGDQLPSDPGEGADPGADGDDDYADAAATPKKKSAAKSGCSAAPGGPAPTGEMFLGLGLVLGAALIRRRRQA